MTEIYPQVESLPLPKLFGQRVGAYIIDTLIAGVGAMLLFMIISLLTWTSLPGPTFNWCGPAPQSPATEEIDRVWPLLPDQTRISILCTFTPIFGPSTTVLRTGFLETQGMSYSSRTLTLRLDDKGNFIPYFALAEALRGASLSIALLVVFVAIDIFQRTQTTGRKILKLKVIQTSQATPSSKQILFRDLLRLLPQIIFIVATFLPSLTMPRGALSLQQLVAYGDDLAINIWMVLSIYGMVLIFWAIWWLLPFLHWTGQTYYDRWIGCQVQPADRSAAL